MIFLVWEFSPFSSLQNEWHAIRVQQSRGWVHYVIHRPELHIMLFRRRINYQQQQEAVAAQMLAK
jgi:cyclin-dependent kinase regulatory subunit CKS1